MTTKLKTIGLMAFFLALGVLVVALFYLLEAATRPDYVVRPGIYTEVGR